jgi:CHASE3 domain sensor protein
MGSKVMKVFLLLVPLIALLMMMAYWTLYGSNSSLMEVMYSLNEWIKANSSIGSSSSSSSGGKGGNSFFSPVKRFKADATKII